MLTACADRNNDYELQVADSNRSALSAACRALKAWKLQSSFSKPDDLIFVANRQGRYIEHDNLIKPQFLPLSANVKAKRFKWHGLRHFAVSTSIEAGLSPKIVQTFAEVEIFSQRP